MIVAKSVRFQNSFIVYDLNIISLVSMRFLCFCVLKFCGFMFLCFYVLCFIMFFFFNLAPQLPQIELSWVSVI